MPKLQRDSKGRIRKTFCHCDPGHDWIADRNKGCVTLNTRALCSFLRILLLVFSKGEGKMSKRNKKRNSRQAINSSPLLPNYSMEERRKKESISPPDSPGFPAVALWFNNQTFEIQRQAITYLSSVLKNPPYKIRFALSKVGLIQMAKTITYCQNNQIPYTPEKEGTSSIVFTFNDLSTRNQAFIGRLTMS